ncbi:MAG: AmmeMemoRadiSam system radical SAM enzyme [Asgard group archaeon]|nr:AmmeMemoRadiSam system radical SAM enzyme [Asgard group archaeon]
MPKHEAEFYEKKEDNKIHCYLCPNDCLILPGKKGRCNVRKNVDGTLYALNYGVAMSGTRDPVEKKPLYHYYPGECAFSYGTIGCNLFCQFCQNWHIARAQPEDINLELHSLSPENAVQKAKRSGCPIVAYTYNEPIIWYEWVKDTAKLMQNAGIKNVLVTNGYIHSEPLEELLPYIDAANVDLKGDEHFYNELCKVKGHDKVKQTCKMMKDAGVHLEITNLLVTNKNDSEEQIENRVKFIVEELGADVPIHFSRYFPHYKLKLPPTPVERLTQARKIALNAGLHYVYLGNVPDDDYSNTFCKECDALLVKRTGYRVRLKNISDENTCENCGASIDIILD